MEWSKDKVPSEKVTYETSQRFESVQSLTWTCDDSASKALYTTGRMCCLISSGGVLVSISFILRMRIKSVYRRERLVWLETDHQWTTHYLHHTASGSTALQPMKLLSAFLIFSFSYLRRLLDFEYLLQLREDVFLIFVIAGFFLAKRNTAVQAFVKRSSVHLRRWETCSEERKEPFPDWWIRVPVPKQCAEDWHARRRTSTRDRKESLRTARGYHR